MTEIPDICEGFNNKTYQEYFKEQEEIKTLETELSDEESDIPDNKLGGYKIEPERKNRGF